MARSEKVPARPARQGDADVSFQRVQGHACMFCNPYGAPVCGMPPVRASAVVVRVIATLGEGSIPNTRYVCAGCIDELNLALCAR